MTIPEASGAGGALKACFQTGAHAPDVCHHGCRRIPRDHTRKRAQGTTVLTAFDNPMLLALQYAKGGGVPSYFPLSAIIDRFYARNQLMKNRLNCEGGTGMCVRIAPLHATAPCTRVNYCRSSVLAYRSWLPR